MRSVTHKPISSANQQYTGIKKYDEKPFGTLRFTEERY
jgi:hypothetical protein